MEKGAENNGLARLDPLLHQPLRTRLAALLAAGAPMSFADLKQQLEASDGNLESHMKKLLEAGYATATKVSGTGRAQTVYSLTVKGEEAFKTYIAALQSLLPPIR